jgi:hypothetical protein
MDSELRIYGYLSRLPETRLARRVFEHRRKTYIENGLRANTPKLAEPSWFSEVHSALEIVDPNPTSASAQFISDTYSKSTWKKLVRVKVEFFDEAALHQAMFWTESGIFYSAIKSKYGPEPYVFAHNRKSAMLKFYLCLRCFGLQARIHHGTANESAKQCKLCALMTEENEEHYLLTCPAFANERQAFVRNLVTKLKASNYHEVLHNLRIAPNNQLVAYLLGGSKYDWTDGAIALINELMRPYLTELAAERKRLMAALNNINA